MKGKIMQMVTKRRLISVMIASAMLTGCQQSATPTATNSQDPTVNQQAAINPVSQAQQVFPLSQISLTGGPFWHAQQTNIDYLLAMKPDRLLAPYLR